MDFENEKEILIGTWTGGADDVSGLRMMVYNYGVVFMEDGTGLSFSWNKKQKGFEEEEDRIEWEYLEKGKIKIRYLDESLKENPWELLTFEILDFKDPYGSKYHKIVDVGQEVFWDFPEPLYKNKIDPKPIGFLNRIWNKIFQ